MSESSADRYMLEMQGDRFFSDPETERTKLFLSQILFH